MITSQQCQRLRQAFENDPQKVMRRNTVTNIGSLLSSIDSEESKQVEHVFLNTLKEKDVRATNQGRSGRCWMFAGLNMFRHNIIRALDIPNFEFSATYLFFWDKFERSNLFLQQFIENDWTPGERRADFHLMSLLEDGGFFSFFANLVMKYGLVPVGAMPETFQSSDSGDMNEALKRRLNSAVCKIIAHRGKWSDEKMAEFKDGVMAQIYDILVMFLGHPPDEEHPFKWSFHRDDGTGHVLRDMTPLQFYQTVAPLIDLHDYAVLVNLPNYPYYQTILVQESSNMVDGIPIKVLNVPIHELKKYAKQSIIAGLPVWFAGDVSQGFDPYQAALNNKLVDDQRVLGEYQALKKGERIRVFDITANHAMLLTGVNLDNGRTHNWQVENSWGYWDNEVPGLDGFMAMSDDWFNENLIQIAVHSRFLSRHMRNCLETEPEIVEPWSCVAPALSVSPVAAPANWLGGRVRQ